MLRHSRSPVRQMLAALTPPTGRRHGADAGFANRRRFRRRSISSVPQKSSRSTSARALAARPNAHGRVVPRVWSPTIARGRRREELASRVHVIGIGPAQRAACSSRSTATAHRTLRAPGDDLPRARPGRHRRRSTPAVPLTVNGARSSRACRAGTLPRPGPARRCLSFPRGERPQPRTCARAATVRIGASPADR